MDISKSLWRRGIITHSFGIFTVKLNASVASITLIKDGDCFSFTLFEWTTVQQPVPCIETTNSLTYRTGLLPFKFHARAAGGELRKRRHLQLAEMMWLV